MVTLKNSTQKPKLQRQNFIVFIVIITVVAVADILIFYHQFILGSLNKISWVQLITIGIEIGLIGGGIIAWILWITKNTDLGKVSWPFSLDTRQRWRIIVFGIVGFAIALVIVLLAPGATGNIISVIINMLSATCTFVSLPALISANAQVEAKPDMPISGNNSTSSNGMASSNKFLSSVYELPTEIPPTSEPIQPRREDVKEIYRELTQANIKIMAITGNTDSGKSTLAALVYEYAERERKAGRDFDKEAIWITILPTATLADVVYTLFKRQNMEPGEPISYNQLHDMLTGEKRLVVLDQFECWFDEETGAALPDHADVDTWLDAVNSASFTSRVLLTSYPSRFRNRQYVPIGIKERKIDRGLTRNEGISLMKGLGANHSEHDLGEVVQHYDGHPFPLALAAVYLKNDPSLSISHFLRDFPQEQQLYDDRMKKTIENLEPLQFKLLSGFSIYRKAVPSKAAEAIFNLKAPEDAIRRARQKLLTSRPLLLRPKGSKFQPYPMVADYIWKCQNAKQQRAHARAARYYQKEAMEHYLPLSQRTTDDVSMLIEAIWHLCQARQHRKALKLAERKCILAHLKKAKDRERLLGVCKMFLPLEKWHPNSSQVQRIQSYEEWCYDDKEQSA